MIYEIITNSTKETKNFASILGANLSAGDVITLEGELGAGKTTFSQGIAIGLEVKRNVTSPTFTIIKEYRGRIPFYHMDVYRLKDSDEDIGYEEYFDGEGATVVEWAQYIEEFLPKNRLDIYLEVINLNKRKITCQSSSTYYDQLLQTIKGKVGEQ